MSKSRASFASGNRRPKASFGAGCGIGAWMDSSFDGSIRLVRTSLISFALRQGWSWKLMVQYTGTPIE